MHLNPPQFELSPIMKSSIVQYGHGCHGVILNAISSALLILILWLLVLISVFSHI